MSNTDYNVDYNVDYNKLFTLIKNNEWDNFKKYINDNNDLDFNLRDDTQEYLLYYAILYNKLDIIKILVEKNARIDITDSEERSLLYLSIKYGYDNITTYLLEKNKESIGINILDIKDKQKKIPLHYAIQKKNIDMIQKLLEYNSNPNTLDINGYNSLHLSIFTRNIDIVKIVLKYIGNINARSMNGETALHLATNLRLTNICIFLIENNININIQDYTHEFSVIHYVATINQIELLNKLIEKKCNINIQDVFGNTALHYAFIEENYNIVSLLMSVDNLNYNLWNINGKLPFHIFLENYNESNTEIFEKLIDKTNLNIKDYNGNSCLFYIINLNLWKQYKHILEKRKIDIFSKNKQNIMLLDLIKDKDKDEFIDLIVKSYLNRLRNKPDLFDLEWENICSKEFDKPIKLKTRMINNKNELQTECEKIIKKNILENINKIKTGEKICNIRSYPSTKNKICININEGEPLSMCTFTGNTLDVLLGLIFLLNKHKKSCSTLTTEFIENKNIQDFYKSMGILMNSRSEFLNFEIIWINYKLYVVNHFFEHIKDCVKAGKQFIILPLGIELKEGSHANYIIYDVFNKVVERFEPHGSTSPPGVNYNPDLLDKILYFRFKEIDENIKYLKPSDYLPKISFQLLDILENKKKKIGDPGGFCALWAIWYVDMRLTYSDLEPKILVGQLIKTIKENNIYVKNMIRNYAVNIINDRDEILKYGNIDINDWLNDDYNDINLDKIINKIKEKIININK
jgi:ankyrin repeat protein